LGEGEGEEVVAEEIVKVEAVSLLFFECEFDHFLTNFFKLSNAVNNGLLAQSTMILIILVAWGLPIRNFLIPPVALQVLAPCPDVIPHELIDPDLLDDGYRVHHDHGVSKFIN